MIVTVRDPDVLKNIEPHQVARYLQAHGWHEQRQMDDKASIWKRLNEEGEEFEILLPLKPEFLDFPRRMYEVLQTLEISEQSSQLQILSDLFTTATNIEIQGMVIEIHFVDSIGTVTLMGVVVGKLRKINVELTEPKYTLAIKAYRERLPVVCTGDLIKEGNTFVLKNPRHFALDEALTD